MNGPSINNIDQWLFEAAEGNLSSAQEAQLDAFLLENPAFVEEQEVWAEAKVVADTPVYPHIDSLLKKPIWVRPAVYIPAAAVVIFGMVYGFSTLMDGGSVESIQQDTSATISFNEQTEEGGSADSFKTDQLTQSNSTSSVSEQQNTAVRNESESDLNVAETKKSDTEVGTNEFKSSSTAELSSEQTKPSNRNAVEVASNDASRAKAEQKTGPKTVQAKPLKTPASNDALVASDKELEPKSSKGKEDQSTQIKEEPIYTAVVVKDGERVEESGMNNSSESQLSNTTTAYDLNNSHDQSAREFGLDEKSVGSENIMEEITATLEREPLEELVNPAGQYANVDGLSLKPKFDQTRIASNYDASFKSIMRTSMRKLVRMMDNPLALKNAKDMVYHVPNMQTLDVNFSSVGSMMVPRLQLVSRAQYIGRSNEQFMNQLAFDTYVRSLRGGVGIQMMNNYYGQGAYNTSQIALAYSPKIGVSKNVVIEPGMRLKFGNTLVNEKKLNPSQLVEVNRMNVEPFFDENSTSIGSSLWYQDVGVSLLTNTKWFTAGVQIDNLGRHYENVYNNLNPLGRRAPLHFTAMLGTDYLSRNKNISFSPYTFYQKMEKLSEIWAGSIFRLKRFTIGGAYSSLGDFAGSIGFKTNLVMLTYSADYTTSAVFNTRLLSHQLSLRILFNSGPYSQRMLKLK